MTKKRDYIDDLIDKYNALGYMAFRYPRKKQISLHGQRPLPENDAVKRMKETIKSKS